MSAAAWDDSVKSVATKILCSHMKASVVGTAPACECMDCASAPGYAHRSQRRQAEPAASRGRKACAFRRKESLARETRRERFDRAAVNAIRACARGASE